MNWETKTKCSEEDFDKMASFCNASDNGLDNRNRAIALGFTNDGVLIAPGAIIRIVNKEDIGSNTFIGLYSYVNGMVKVEENVLIGPHCSITSNNHAFNPENMSFQGKSVKAPIVIGAGSWLATGVTVTAGVNIGKGNLICANTVVTKSTPDFAIVSGTPGRVVGKINTETGENIWFKE